MKFSYTERNIIKRLQAYSFFIPSTNVLALKSDSDVFMMCWGVGVFEETRCHQLLCNWSKSSTSLVNSWQFI